MQQAKYAYIYELDYAARKEVCNILNQRNKWEELAVLWMKFDEFTIRNLRKARDPTDELFTIWGHYNHTIAELFVLLAHMREYQAMMALKPYIPEKYQSAPKTDIENLKKCMRIKKSRKGSTQLKRINEEDVKIKNVDKKEELPVEEYQKKEGEVYESPKSDSVDVISSFGNMHLTLPDDFVDEDDRLKAIFKHLGSSLPKISSEDLVQATNQWNFANVIGEGGFGIVYRGTWKNTEVAIKRIEPKDSEGENDKYLQNYAQSLREVKILNSRVHENILPLYAYGLMNNALYLVYQYMPNGTLMDRLWSQVRSKWLNWRQRFCIARGTARGLQYLHTIGKKPLIHGDIKSANILLDRNDEARIGDFGLAKEGSKEDSMKVDSLQGTKPYLPRDYLSDRILSTKIDTYSFGVVLFEMATGALPYCKSRPHHYLRDMCFEMDPLDTTNADTKGGLQDIEVYTNIVTIGKWCTSEAAKDRPRMDDVYKALDQLS